jgi:hypothetical protein
MSPDPKQLARFARVEPPAELDAWVRAKLRASVTERCAAVSERAGADDDATERFAARSGTGLLGRASEPSEARPTRARASRAAAPVPFIERVVLATGAVACGIQASGFVLRLVWSALTLGR